MEENKDYILKDNLKVIKTENGYVIIDLSIKLKDGEEYGKGYYFKGEWYKNLLSDYILIEKEYIENRIKELEIEIARPQIEKWQAKDYGDRTKLAILKDILSNSKTK